MPLYNLTNANDVFPKAPQVNTGSGAIYGFGGNDQINAGAGSNVVYGGEGNGTVTSTGPLGQAFYGRWGDDQLTTYAGNDVLEGGDGNDTLTDDGGDNTLRGGAGNDVLWIFTSSEAAGMINYGYGGSGDDTITVRTLGASHIYGGTENDIVSLDLTDTSRGVAALFGDDGTDRSILRINQPTLDSVTGPHEAAMVLSGDHIDLMPDGAIRGQVGAFETLSVTVTGDHAALLGGAGDDSFTLGDPFLNGIQGGQVSAGDGKDLVTIYSGAGAFVLDGGLGQDTLALDYSNMSTDAPVSVTVDMTTATRTGSTGTSQVTATGFEVLTFAGGTGDDIVRGSAGNDTISGFYDVRLHAGDRDLGADNYDGGAGNDILYGGFDADTLVGGDGKDSMEGGEAGDRIYGGLGDDTLVGDCSLFRTTPGGADMLFGGGSNDVLIGGIGNDTVAGGNGADRFGVEEITDSGVAQSDVDTINRGQVACRAHRPAPD